MNKIDRILKEAKQKPRKMSILLKNIKKNHKMLKSILEKASGHWAYEDRIYRYYHTSFKVYYLQEVTLSMVSMLMKISPHKDKGYLNKDFLEILNEGTGKEWKLKDNQKWSKVCRPIVEAFLHTKFFLEMAVKYGKELKKAPNALPSGWAALLYLYNIR